MLTPGRGCHAAQQYNVHVPQVSAAIVLSTAILSVHDIVPVDLAESRLNENGRLVLGPQQTSQGSARMSASDAKADIT